MKKIITVAIKDHAMPRKILSPDKTFKTSNAEAAWKGYILMIKNDEHFKAA